MEKTLITDLSELFPALRKVVKDAMVEMNEEVDKRKRADKLYTINQVRLRLGKSHKTIKNLVLSGVIKSTASGLISEVAINEYLQNS